MSTKVDYVSIQHRLEQEAKKFNTGNHLSFLAEVQNVLVRTDDEEWAKYEALRLLVGLWKSTNREQPKRALKDIGSWLENRIQAGSTPTILRYEVGWLKRLVGIFKNSDHEFEGERESHSRLSPACPFGSSIPKNPTQKKPTSPIQKPKFQSKVIRAVGMLSRTKNDGLLKVLLDKGEEIFSRGQAALTLYGTLDESVKKRLDKSKEVHVTVEYKEDGNAREIISLLPIAKMS